MNPEIEKLHLVWEHNQKASRNVDLPPISLEQIISTIYSAGPTYHYVVDFYDMSLSHVSPLIAMHGLSPETATFNDVLSLIHPDDVEYVAQTESRLNDMFIQKIGREKVPLYKLCYSVRFRMANGEYKLFLHQSLVLTVDEKGGFGKSINIHTDISHITTTNNYRVSLIGLMGEPSYMDIDLFSDSEKLSNTFSKREVEVIKLIAEGFVNAEISEKLNIALDTAKNHRRNIMKKAGVKNTAQLIKKCMLEGLV